jgi:hypothetical protein
MRNGNQHPIFAPLPLPLPFLGLEGEDDIAYLSLIRIFLTHFFIGCLNLFGMSSFHSWCALSHFSTSTKCLQEGCGQEMHPLWWAQVGKKSWALLEKRDYK